MAGDRDRVAYTAEDVKSLLANMRDAKKEESALGVTNERLRFLEHCLNQLDDYERDILIKTFSEGVSMRKYSRYTGFSRSFIAKQRERSAELVAKFFNIKYGC